MSLTVDSRTHIGLVHHTNEDSLTIFDTPRGKVLAVCDGMGGMGRGDEASAIAVEVLEEDLSGVEGFPPHLMEAAIQKADIAIRRRLAVPGNTPGATAVMVHVHEALAHITWAGDSRAYLIRDGAVLERTRDHKLVNELVDAGELTEEEARLSSLAHVVTKALGGRGPNEPTIEADSLGHPWKLHKGDLILLCSDGLCDLVDDQEIGTIVSGHDLVVDLETLVKMALDRGGHDNITIILARWDGEDFNEEEQSTPLIPEARERDPVDSNDESWMSAKTWQDPPTEDEAKVETVPPADERPSPEPRPAEPEEEGKPWVAVVIAVIALVLILLGLLMMQGVFTGNASVQTDSVQGE